MTPLEDVVSLLRCLQCGSHAHAVTTASVRCVVCGKASPVRDGILHLTSGAEDPAIERERHAMLALESQGTAGPHDYTLENLLAGPSVLRSAFMSLPYDDGSTYFRDNHYFKEVSKFADEFTFVVERLGVAPGGRILDVAADSTWSTAQLARRGWRPTAIDINHHLIANVVFRDLGISFPAVNVDMHAQAFQDDVFDGVTAFSALHHTHRLLPLVANLARVLKPGGRLGLIEPYWVNEDARQSFGIAQIEAGINENIYRLEEWHQALVNSGLELVAAAAGDPFYAVYAKVAHGRTLTVDQAWEDLFKGYYSSRIAALGPSTISAAPGARVTLPVAVTNQSSMSWCSIGQVPVYVSYHLHSYSGRPDPSERAWTTVAFDNPRTVFSRPLHAGERAIVVIDVTAPSTPGDYAIEIDLVQEGVTWYRDRGGETAVVHLAVGQQ